MKAIVLYKYGSPDYFESREVDKPIPKANEVLVKVHATSVNSWDGDALKGIPFVNRINFGLFKPKSSILGCDIAGRIEALGKNVTQLKIGDAIFGDISGSGWGGFAEYVSVSEKVLAKKPEGMTFEQAAAIPHTGVLALQGLRDKGNIQKGQKVLINGAGGGSGTFAVQIAKTFGAEVTAVDKGIKLDKLRSLGADHVIDYTKEDFTKNGKEYDIILDVVTYRSIDEYKASLSPGGKFVMLGGGSYDKVFQVMWKGPLITMKERISHGKGGKKMSILMHKPNKEDLNVLTELFETGKISPVIDKQYHLSEVPEAFHYFREGQAIGKLVITI